MNEVVSLEDNSNNVHELDIDTSDMPATLIEKELLWNVIMKKFV